MSLLDEMCISRMRIDGLFVVLISLTFCPPAPSRLRSERLPPPPVEGAITIDPSRPHLRCSTVANPEFHWKRAACCIPCDRSLGKKWSTFAASVGPRSVRNTTTQTTKISTRTSRVVFGHFSKGWSCPGGHPYSRVISTTHDMSP